jgi:hypothetical protein
MRELKPTLRNGFRQGREPPLHYFRNQNDSQNLTANNQLFYRISQWRQQPFQKLSGI